MIFFTQPCRPFLVGFLFSGLIFTTSITYAEGMGSPSSETVADSADKSVVDEDVNNFLLRVADSRLMNMKEGNIAVEIGNSPLIRDYGRKMIKDHYSLLVKVRRLAQARTISLPTDLSEERKKALIELQHASGEDFDKKYMAMLIADHDKDLKDFRKAIELKDIDVSDFALKYLPVIQSHLEEIKTIKKSL